MVSQMFCLWPFSVWGLVEFIVVVVVVVRFANRQDSHGFKFGDLTENTMNILFPQIWCQIEEQLHLHKGDCPHQITTKSHHHFLA
jgi:hypothetical protein